MPVSSALRNITKQPSLVYYYGQKALRSPALRQALGGFVARLTKRPGTAGMETPGAEQVARELNENGLCFLPQLHISDDGLADIRACLNDKPVVDWYDGITTHHIDSAPAACSKLSYRTADLVGCPALLQLANSPLILDAVARVLGAQPTIAWFQSWWTLGEHHIPGKAHFDDIYHRDVDDLRFVKLFAYLTDTDIRNGAHSFVRGSHRSSVFTRRGAISDEEVHANFPPEDILAVTGTAGTVFLENTWGIHRPLLATEGRRLIFSALYCLKPWVPRGERETPGGQMPAGLDPYVNRMLFKN